MEFLFVLPEKCKLSYPIIPLALYKELAYRLPTMLCGEYCRVIAECTVVFGVVMSKMFVHSAMHSLEHFAMSSAALRKVLRIL